MSKWLVIIVIFHQFLVMIASITASKISGELKNGESLWTFEW